MDKRSEIIETYKNNSLLTNTQIARKFGTSPQYISQILKELRIDKESEILRLYFDEGKTKTDISNLSVATLPTIRRTLESQGERYIEEELKRKQNTREMQHKKKIENNRKRRGQSVNDFEVMEGLRQLQANHALDMSIGSKISNTQMVLINIQRYELSKSGKSLKYSYEAVPPSDLPKRISVKLFSNVYKTFEESKV